jgi:hypothetical protein
MVKVNTVKDGVLFAIPDVPSEHQKEQVNILEKFKIVQLIENQAVNRTKGYKKVTKRLQKRLHFLLA